MNDLEERTNILRWIAQIIAIEGFNAPWVTKPRQIFIKDSLSFSAKFWWVVVHDRLRTTVNDNTIHTLQAHGSLYYIQI